MNIDSFIIFSKVYLFIIECNKGVMIKKLLLIMDVRGVIVVCYCFEWWSCWWNSMILINNVILIVMLFKNIYIFFGLMVFVLVSMFNIILGGWLMVSKVFFYFGFMLICNFCRNYFEVLYVMVGWCFVILVIIVGLIWWVYEFW